MKKLTAIVSLMCITFVSGCNSTVSAPELDKPLNTLELLPVKFKVLIDGDTVYYALTDTQYINLSLNMLNIQRYIYQESLWNETLKRANDGLSAFKDVSNQRSER